MYPLAKPACANGTGGPDINTQLSSVQFYVKMHENRNEILL